MDHFSFFKTILYELSYFERKIDERNNKYSLLGYNILKEEII